MQQLLPTLFYSASIIGKGRQRGASEVLTTYLVGGKLYSTMDKDVFSALSSHKDRLDKGKPSSCSVHVNAYAVYAIEYDKDAKASSGTPLQQYDPDAFDSMAVINSEVWNDGHQEGKIPSVDEILPKVKSNISNHTGRGRVSRSQNLYQP